METSKVNKKWPNSLRYFLVQGLHSFTPWHIFDYEEEFASAASAFEKEDVDSRKVFVFASRQDNDDFAGLEIVDGKITDKVIHFHPTFSSSESNRSWNIVDGEFSDIFEFMSKQVMPDMKDWALTDDASEL